MKVRVSVSLKNGVLDPQGRAIQHARVQCHVTLFYAPRGGNNQSARVASPAAALSTSQ